MVAMPSSTTVSLRRFLSPCYTAAITTLLLLLLLPVTFTEAYVTLRPPRLSSMTQPSSSSASANSGSLKGTQSNVVISDAGLLIKNYRPLPPSDNEPLDVRCALLHISARKALKSGKMEIARR